MTSEETNRKINLYIIYVAVTGRSGTLFLSFCSCFGGLQAIVTLPTKVTKAQM